MINPISANQNTIVIKRKTAKKKALLDYKFVFMQEQTAFKASPQSQQRNSQINYPRSAKLTGVFANPQKIHQQIIVQKPKPQTTQTQSKAIDIYDDNNWNDYATESSLDTSLGVKAWIIGK
ncbi:MAG: hypothetical protein HOA17_03675 [Candidatus Melainabacteria bacterium]|nr:hypothetical protein [Candidatus Melainabacteria bacterium]